MRLKRCKEKHSNASKMKHLMHLNASIRCIQMRFINALGRIRCFIVSSDAPWRVFSGNCIQTKHPMRPNAFEKQTRVDAAQNKTQLNVAQSKTRLNAFENIFGKKTTRSRRFALRHHHTCMTVSSFLEAYRTSDLAYVKSCDVCGDVG